MIASRTINRAASDNVSMSGSPVQASLLMYLANAGCRYCGISGQADREILVNWRSACSSNSICFSVALLGWAAVNISGLELESFLRYLNTVDAVPGSAAFFCDSLFVKAAIILLWPQPRQHDIGGVCGQGQQPFRAASYPDSRVCV